MTVRLTYLDQDTGLTHTHVGAVERALANHVDPDRTARLFRWLEAAGGTHDVATCERCQAVAAAKARAASPDTDDRLIRLAASRGVFFYKRERDESDDDRDARELATSAYVEAYYGDDDQHREDLMRTWKRRMRDLTARVNACPRNKLSELIGELRAEVKRCREIADNVSLSESARLQGDQLMRRYRRALEQALHRLLHPDDDTPRPKYGTVRSTPRALGMIATYEPVCSCGYGYVL